MCWLFRLASNGHSNNYENVTRYEKRAQIENNYELLLPMYHKILSIITCFYIHYKVSVTMMIFFIFFFNMGMNRGPIIAHLFYIRLEIGKWNYPFGVGSGLCYRFPYPSYHPFVVFTLLLTGKKKYTINRWVILSLSYSYQSLSILIFSGEESVSLL